MEVRNERGERMDVKVREGKGRRDEESDCFLIRFAGNACSRPIHDLTPSYPFNPTSSLPAQEHPIN